MKGTESIMAYLRDRIPRNQEDDEAAAAPTTAVITQPWSSRIDQFGPKKWCNSCAAFLFVSAFYCIVLTWYCTETGLLKKWKFQGPQHRLDGADEWLYQISAILIW